MIKLSCLVTGMKLYKHQDCAARLCRQNYFKFSQVFF